MYKLLFLLTLFICQTSHAALFFSAEKTRFVPVLDTIPHREFFDRHHLLSRKQIEVELKKLEKSGLYTTVIPQTTWELFALLNYFRGVLPLKGIEGEDKDKWRLVNNAFINYLNNQGDIQEAFLKGDYPTVSRRVIRDILLHLRTYNDTVQPIFANLGDPSAWDTRLPIKMWLFIDSHFPLMEPVLVKATELEADAYEKDEILLWRHSRTAFDFRTADQVFSVFDVPLHLRSNRDPKYASSDEIKTELAVGTLSYGFSPLADYVGDGSLYLPGEFGPQSACALVYFMNELLNRVYIGEGLPFYIEGQGFIPKEQVQKTFPKNTFFAVTRFKKSFFKRHLDAEAGTFPKGSSWFMPRIFANDWIIKSGEDSHPRFRGTHLKRVEQKEPQLFIYETKSKFPDQEILEYVGKMIDSTSDMEILVSNGNITTSKEAEKWIEDRKKFRELLKTPETQSILLRQLPISFDGVDFQDQ